MSTIETKQSRAAVAPPGYKSITARVDEVLESYTREKANLILPAVPG